MTLKERVNADYLKAFKEKKMINPNKAMSFEMVNTR